MTQPESQSQPSNESNGEQPAVPSMDAVRERMRQLADASRRHGEQVVGELAARTAASDKATQAGLAELNAQAAELNELARTMPSPEDVFFPHRQ
jgi:hypothetical protein